jgi:homoserine acetyltransferase
MRVVRRRIRVLQVPCVVSGCLGGTRSRLWTRGCPGGVGRYQSGAAPSLSSWRLLPAAIGRRTILRASRKLNLP